MKDKFGTSFYAIILLLEFLNDTHSEYRPSGSYDFSVWIAAGRKPTGAWPRSLILHPAPMQDQLVEMIIRDPRGVEGCSDDECRGLDVAVGLAPPC